MAVAYPRLACGLHLRQIQLLQLVADGDNVKSASYKLHISNDMGKSDMKQIKRALGAKNATHAVYIGFKIGILR